MFAIAIVTLVVAAGIGVLLVRLSGSLQQLAASHETYLAGRAPPASARIPPDQAVVEYERIAEDDATLIRNFSRFAREVRGQFLQLGALLLAIAGLQGMLLFNLRKLLSREHQ